MNRVWGVILVMMVGHAFCGRPAWATQYLVSPGDDWAKLSNRLRPGDEVILLPGRHVAGRIEGLRGKSGAPIIIRGFNPANPAIIGARAFGIDLIDARHVTLRDLQIVGATTVGIRIRSQAQDDHSRASPGGIQLQRIQVVRTGDYESGVGISIEGVRDVLVDSCTVRVFGAGAIDVRDAANVTIEDCMISGDPDYLQQFGVRVAGTSRLVRLSRCRIVSQGTAPIQVGDLVSQRGSANDDGPITLPTSQVSVESCIVRGGRSSMTIGSAMTVSIRRSTFIDPERSVAYILLTLQDIPEDVRTRVRFEFDGNLMAIASTDFSNPIEAAFKHGASPVHLTENLWWGGAESELDPSKWPVVLDFPQILDIDPQLDAHGRPSNAHAEMFGRIWPAGERVPTADQPSR